MSSGQVAPEPKPIELLWELRSALGLENYARPDSPKAVWLETLGEVSRLRSENAYLRDRLRELDSRMDLDSW